MQTTDENIIARFLISVAQLRDVSIQNPDIAIGRFGRPYVSQQTGKGYELAQATAMLHQALCAP